MCSTSWMSAVPSPDPDAAPLATGLVDHLLNVTVDDEHPRGTVVTVRGEVDMYTVGRLREALDGVTAGYPRAVVLDLEQVEFFSLHGLTALVDLRRAATLRRFPVGLANVPRAVLRPLTATGLAELFDRFSTVHSALRELPEPRRPGGV